MITLALQIMAALACGPLDRLRGHHVHLFNLRMADKVAYGFALALVAAPADPIAVPFIMIAMILGMSPGWGEPIGATLENRDMRKEHLEWWQKGLAATDPMTALAIRGVIWGLPIVPVALWFEDWSLLGIIPAFAIAMPLSMFAAKLEIGKDKWGNTEFARGWIAAVIIFLTSLF